MWLKRECIKDMYLLSSCVIAELLYNVVKLC